MCPFLKPSFAEVSSFIAVVGAPLCSLSTAYYVYYKHIRAEISAQFEYLINETESGRQSPMLMSWENVVAIKINTPCYLKR